MQIDHYPWEKSYDALRYLAGPGELGERLRHAYNLALIRLRPEQLSHLDDPEDEETLASRLEAITATFQEHGADPTATVRALHVNEIGTTEAAIRSMTDDQVRATAERVFDFAYDVIKRHIAARIRAE